jgi:hypothetical protein
LVFSNILLSRRKGVQINFSSWNSIKYFTNTNQFTLSFNTFNYHHPHLTVIVVTTSIIATTLSLQRNFYVSSVSSLSPYLQHSMISPSLSLLYYYCCCCCCFIIISNHIIILLVVCFSHYHLLNIIKYFSCILFYEKQTHLININY